MLNKQNTGKIEITVRLYDNDKYGTTHGKGLYRKAIFNGSIDAANPQVKYIIDLYSYDDWINQAKTDGQMEIARQFNTRDENLYSWIFRYDLKTKNKTLVDGLCNLNLQSLEMLVMICDTQVSVYDTWEINAKPCKKVYGKNSPQLLATNATHLDASSQSAETSALQPESCTTTLQQRMQALYS